MLPYLTHKADVKHKFKANHYLILLIGAVLVASMAFFQTNETEPMQNLTFSTYILLFFSGWIASSAMILPGISGSFILLIIGVYSTVVGGVSDLKFDIIAVVGLGILFGIVVMSKIVKFFFGELYFRDLCPNHWFSYWVSICYFPGVPGSAALWLVSALAFIGGLVVAWLLGRVEYK